MQFSFPIAVGDSALSWAGHSGLAIGSKQSREERGHCPAPGSPNVLLIVLDTVAAGHLSLYGYERPTSTTLVELAGRGIRFDSARAASSWTLAIPCNNVHRTMDA